MARLYRGTIRLEYDRTGQNQELEPYWDKLEDRPYYDLEERYTEQKGTDTLTGG